MLLYLWKIRPPLPVCLTYLSCFLIWKLFHVFPQKSCAFSALARHRNLDWAQSLKQQQHRLQLQAAGGSVTPIFLWLNCRVSSTSCFKSQRLDRSRCEYWGKTSCNLIFLLRYLLANAADTPPVACMCVEAGGSTIRITPFSTDFSATLVCQMCIQPHPPFPSVFLVIVAVSCIPQQFDCWLDCVLSSCE